MAARKKSNKKSKTIYAKSTNRRSVNDQGHKKIVRSITVLLFLAIVGVIGFGVYLGFRQISRYLFSENSAFEIKHLVISTNGRLNETLIREFSANESAGLPSLQEGQNLFARKLSEIENILLETPQIESVHIERILPHTLKVSVAERDSIARILGVRSSKFPSAIDRSGVVLSYKRKDVSLPLIKGLDEELLLGAQVKNRDVDYAIELVMICDRESQVRKYVKIDSIDLQYEDFMDVRINDGETRVRMPRYTIEKKLKEVATLIEVARSRGEKLREIDMTVEGSGKPVVPY